MQFGGPISDFRYPILFGISLQMRINLLRVYFCFFFRWSDSLKFWIKQPQSYLKNQNNNNNNKNNNNNNNLEILFYRVLVGKLQKLHLFKSSRPGMFYK